MGGAEGEEAINRKERTMSVATEWLPKDVDGIDLAFGGEMKALLPPRNSLPDEFQRRWHSNPWCDIAGKWFFSGLPKGTTYKPKAGIDTNKALRHLGAILRSWEPQHEHKIGAVGWLMSIWFDEIKVPKKKK